MSRLMAGTILVALSTTPASPGALAVGQSTQYIPPTAEIVRLLESNTPSEQAWGSWLAAQARTPDLVPRLQAVADRYLAARDWREGIVTSAALDALIQIRAPVPSVWCLTFLEKWPAQSIILLSLAADDAGPVLLDIARNRRGTLWLAAANQLLKRRTPGFAAHLLGDVEIVALVFVTRDKAQVPGGVLGSSLGSGHSGVAPLPGFPPLASYYLSSAANPGGVVLTPGPVDIYYFREVSAPGETPVTTSQNTTAPLTRHRLQYAWALLGLGGRPGLSAVEARSVVWTNQKNLDAEIEALKSEVERRFAGLVQQLETGRFLTADEARALPSLKIRVQINDNR